MKSVGVFIAESNYLVRKGLCQLIFDTTHLTLVGSAESGGELLSQVVNANPRILFINYTSPLFSREDILTIKHAFPAIRILAITATPDAADIRDSRGEVHGHLLYSCGREEILSAIEALNNEEVFYCGKVMEQLEGIHNQQRTCAGILLTKRELEIVQLVSSGLSNKEVALRTCLSVYTVQTHRKNIMSKLGVKNTAGLLMYALKNNLIESY